MKKIISIVTITLITLLSSCSVIARASKVNVDPILEPLYKEWKKDAKAYEIDTDKTEENLRIVNLENLTGGKLGVYRKYLGLIEIDKSLLDYPYSIRAVFYHEMGHAAGIPHTCEICTSIMSVSRDTNKIDGLFKYESIWKRELKIYFETIKKLQDEKSN